MERPNKYAIERDTLPRHCLVYKATDIDPLLDELERLKADKKPFPSLEDFTQFYYKSLTTISVRDIYNYFSQFQYEKTVYPKVGDIVEGETFNGYKIVGKLTSFYVCSDEALHVNTICPVTPPTREEVVAKVESKLDNDELTFDRELVEQFLKMLKGVER